MTFFLNRARLRWASWTAVLGLAACAQTYGPGDETPAVTFSHQSFPRELARYEAPLFDLVRPEGRRYDAQLARQLRALLASQLRTEGHYVERLTSGPAPAASYYVVGRRGYVYFSACQAHDCDASTLDVLFDPTDRRLVGKLQDKGILQWVGGPDERESVLLDHLRRVSSRDLDRGCGRC